MSVFTAQFLLSDIPRDGLGFSYFPISIQYKCLLGTIPEYEYGRRKVGGAWWTKKEGGVSHLCTRGAGRGST